jgi:hypothetical protein
MQALPSELQLQIFAYLLPAQDLRDLVAVPISGKSQRADIYNVRLTCRLLRNLVSSFFVRIIEDVPTECIEASMQRLASLVALPEIGEQLKCLTINNCKIFISDERKPTFLEVNARDEWLRSTFRHMFLDIASKIPNVRHLVYSVEAVRNSRAYKAVHMRARASNEEMNLYECYDKVRWIPDPMYVSSQHSICVSLEKVFRVQSPDDGTDPINSTMDIQARTRILL